MIIAADSGLHSATELGLAVDVVVGDMDSVLPEALRDAGVAGTEIVRYPPEKDATDLA
ncbi:MAG: Thiamine diphosphokinase, partial [Acidimicrobiia bacterium]|nr:Thiamine diphosphokinase [Acidimicrobiia bacterium]